MKDKLTKENMKKIAKGLAIGAAGVAIGMIGFKAGRKKMADEIVDFMNNEIVSEEDVYKKYQEEYNVDDIGTLPDEIFMGIIMEVECEEVKEAHISYFVEEIKDMI